MELREQKLFCPQAGGARSRGMAGTQHRLGLIHKLQQETVSQQQQRPPPKWGPRDPTQVVRLGGKSQKLSSDLHTCAQHTPTQIPSRLGLTSGLTLFGMQVQDYTPKKRESRRAPRYSRPSALGDSLHWRRAGQRGRGGFRAVAGKECL